MDGVELRAKRAEYMRAWYRTDGGRAYRAKRMVANAERNRKWNHENLEKRREQNRRSRNNTIDARLEYSRKYHAENKVKDSARAAVARAIKRGELFRPESCSDCGKTCKAEAHHHLGYSRENRLDVQWLCTVCHRAADSRQP